MAERQPRNQIPEGTFALKATYSNILGRDLQCVHLQTVTLWHSLCNTHCALLLNRFGEGHAGVES